MRYAAEFLCKNFNRTFSVGQWVDLNDGRYAKLKGPAHVYANEARVLVEVEAVNEYINPATVKKQEAKNGG